ncbi:protein MSP1-like [Hibiscus syriacus]|uniref:protein MSP1-like n=1 Tax=Hibiscus syriacus TaxID=106335 RepID=UPI001920C285|nr:protein MSP1-like [Hibiscus syriacus]
MVYSVVLYVCVCVSVSFLQDVIACDVIYPDHIDVEFESIGGLKAIKHVLYELVILPLRRTELFSHGRLLGPQKGVLLYGPSGRKTMLTQASAKESGAVCINLRMTDLMNRWFGMHRNLRMHKLWFLPQQIVLQN